MVPSPLLCRRFPSYSRGSGRACTEPQIRARAHTHLQEVRLLNFIAGNATALQKDLNGTKRDLDIGWLILCGALVFFMQVLCVCVRFDIWTLCVCAHTALHGVFIWGMHLYIFRRDLRCWRRASYKAKTWQIFCSKMRLTFPLPLFATGLSDTGYACVCVFLPLVPLRHMHAWSAAMSSTRTHLNIGTVPVFA